MRQKIWTAVSHGRAAWRTRASIEFGDKLVLFFLMMFLGGSTLRGKTVTWFVSPAGKDAHDGSLERPLHTLERARDAIRARRKSSGTSAPVTVYLRQGVYRLSSTFELTKQDSGLRDAPVTFRPWKDEAVMISGAKLVSGLAPVT